MPNHPAPHSWRTLTSLFFSLLVLAACSLPPSQPAREATPAPEASASPFTTPTALAPSPTPTPLPGKVILLTAGPAGSGLAETLEAVLAELSSSSGLQLEKRSALTREELTDQVRLVIFASQPEASLDDLKAAAPAVQFLALDLPELQPRSDLVQLNRSNEQQAFLAGTLAILVTAERRVGVLSRGDTLSGQASREGFLNGARYQCGLCNPKYPPYAGYPVYAEADGPGSWQAAVSELVAKGVKTVYVDPELQAPELLELLVLSKLKIIGGVGGEVPEALRANWVATVRSDWEAALRSLWPALLAGEAAAQGAAPLEVTEIDAELLTEGRMRVVEETLQALNAGWIYPASVPVD